MLKAQSCPAGTFPYVIKSGDTYFILAQRFNTTVAAIEKANPGVDPNRLFIGQVICIPGATPPTPPSQTCPTLRMGSQGSSVVELQRLLLANGFNPGTIDGIFGPNTQAAVMNFQRSVHIAIDGVVGIQTWTALGVNCGTAPTTCPPGTRPYTIKAGDTFWTLAIRFNTTVEAIQRANPTVNPNSLQIGQVICMP